MPVWKKIILFWKSDRKIIRCHFWHFNRGNMYEKIFDLSEEEVALLDKVKKKKIDKSGGSSSIYIKKL